MPISQNSYKLEPTDTEDEEWVGRIGEKRRTNASRGGSAAEFTAKEQS
jgi:hypothetical protein